LDEDAGWKRTPVTIPYQLRRGVSPDPDAGARSYMIFFLFSFIYISNLCPLGRTYVGHYKVGIRANLNRGLPFLRL
jgi:hypothetical protein